MNTLKPEGAMPNMEINEDNKLEIAHLNMDRWKEALLLKNPENVAQLYSEKSTFLPTVSNEFKKGTEEARQYFVHFLEKDPEGTVVEEEVQIMSTESYVHSGLYNFMVGQGSTRQELKARFTFIWALEDGEWKIIHHHSSVLPQV